FNKVDISLSPSTKSAEAPKEPSSSHSNESLKNDVLSTIDTGSKTKIASSNGISPEQDNLGKVIAAAGESLKQVSSNSNDTGV
ncbi:hypothetical protein ACO1MB_14435, partial [Staphylococcus aureus]